MTGENPANHVFVDWDVERQGEGDLLCNSRSAPVGIPLLHFDDRMNELSARSCGRAADGDSVGTAFGTFACSEALAVS
jgi:hypothetical protein